MALQIITNYTPSSHVLYGEALKDVYSDFRINVLREAEWATWHGKMRLPEGKGWCIRKANLPDLEAALQNASIPYEKIEYVAPSTTMVRSSRKKIQQPTEIMHGDRGGPATSDYGTFDKQRFDRAFDKAFDRIVVPAIDRAFNKVFDSLDQETPGSKNLENPVNPDTYEHKWRMWVEEDPNREYKIETHEAYGINRHIFKVIDADGEMVLFSIPDKPEDHDFMFKSAWVAYFNVPIA